MIDSEALRLNANAFIVESGGPDGIQSDRWLDVTSSKEGSKLGLGHTTIVRDRAIEPITFDVQAVGLLGLANMTRPHGPFSIEVEEGEGPIYVPKKPYEVSVAMTSRYVVGSSALLAVIETRDLTIVPSGPETPETPQPIDEKPVIFQGATLGKVSLLVLQAGQVVQIALGDGKDMEVYEAVYEPEDLVIRDGHGNVIGGDDENPGPSRGFGGGPSGGGDHGGGSDRRNPHPHPRRPSGSAGAVAVPEHVGGSFRHIPPKTLQ